MPQSLQQQHTAVAQLARHSLYAVVRAQLQQLVGRQVHGAARPHDALAVLPPAVHLQRQRQQQCCEEFRRMESPCNLRRMESPCNLRRMESMQPMPSWRVCSPDH